MRKLFPLLVVLMVLLVSSFVLADNSVLLVPPTDAQLYNQHVNDDGIKISEQIGANFIVLDYIQNRNGGYYKDVNGQNPQSTTLTIKAEAYIPCYIKMTVKGNMGLSTLESFGPNADSVATAQGYLLLFDNEVGGYVDTQWGILGHGRNAEIAPAANVFIQACDQLEVVVYANDTFRYDVIGSALKAAANVDTAVASEVLPMDMRTQVDQGTWVLENFNELAAKTVNIAEKHATESMTALHHFRVPYSESTAHGKYSGNVVLKAYTI